jgi:hypothetical protein
MRGIHHAGCMRDEQDNAELGRSEGGLGRETSLENLALD